MFRFSSIMYVGVVIGLATGMAVAIVVLVALFFVEASAQQEDMAVSDAGLMTTPFHTNELNS
jgi:hypothetical protein